MSKFDFAFQYLLGDEGTTFVDDPADSGGATKYGITKATYEEYLGHVVAVDDVEFMAEDTAAKIYQVFWWEPLKLDLVTSDAIATAIFDTCVLYGQKTGVKMAQKALNEFGQGLDVDGLMGEKTLASLNSAQDSQFIPAFKDQIMARIESIILSTPKDKKFMDGWTNRAARLLTLVTKTKTGGLT